MLSHFADFGKSNISEKKLQHRFTLGGGGSKRRRSGKPSFLHFFVTVKVESELHKFPPSGSARSRVHSGTKLPFRSGF